MKRGFARLSIERISRHALFRQMIRYGLSSGLSGFVTLGLPIFLHEVLGVPVDHAVRTALILAFFLNFLVLRSYVFKAQADRGRQIFLYLLTSIGFRSTEYLVFTLLFNVVELNYVVALIAVLATSTALKFILFRQLIFRPSPGPEKPK